MQCFPLLRIDRFCFWSNVNFFNLHVFRHFLDHFDELRFTQAKSQVDFRRTSRYRQSAIAYTNFIGMTQISENFRDIAV